MGALIRVIGSLAVLYVCWLFFQFLYTLVAAGVG